MKTINWARFACAACALPVLMLTCLAARATTVRSDTPIRWEVANRFRPFDFVDASNAPKLFARYRTEPGEDAKAWSNRVVQLGSPYRSSAASPWDEARGTYKAGYMQLPEKLAILVSLDTSTSQFKAWEGRKCLWHVEGSPPLQPTPCDDKYLIDQFPSRGAFVSVSVQGTNLNYRLPAPAIPAPLIILGLGDSYAAGEGAPDSPAAWRPILPQPKEPLATLRLWNYESALLQGASWESNLCNRSFYSWQSIAALHIASEPEHAHQVVIFVHLACAGAEVIDGMLAPQINPPGFLHSACRTQAAHSRLPETQPYGCNVRYSQLRAATDLLCKDHGSGKLDDATLRELTRPLAALKYASGRRNPNGRRSADQIPRISDLHQCRHGALPVYLVLLHIGGNDIGFSGVIANSIVPYGHNKNIPLAGWAVRKIREHVATVTVHGIPGGNHDLSATDRLSDLDQRFVVLQHAFTKLLGVPPDRVIISQYPNPLHGNGGVMCGNEPYSKTNNQWLALKSRLTGLVETLWEFNLTADEADINEKVVIDPLNRAIAENSPQWHVSAASDSYFRQGWCAGTWLLHYSASSSALWRPYADTGRGIRTANDSALTQWPPKVDGRNDGLSGTFHPNGQGYAAIAATAIESIKEVEPTLRGPD